MPIYLDSAKLDEARQAKDLGWVYGVTTNPTLMAKAGVKPENVLMKLAQHKFHQVYYQLVSQDVDEMLVEAFAACEIVNELSENTVEQFNAEGVGIRLKP